MCWEQGAPIWEWNSRPQGTRASHRPIQNLKLRKSKRSQRGSTDPSLHFENVPWRNSALHWMGTRHLRQNVHFESQSTQESHISQGSISLVRTVTWNSGQNDTVQTGILRRLHCRSSEKVLCLLSQQRQAIVVHLPPRLEDQGRQALLDFAQTPTK